MHYQHILPLCLCLKLGFHFDLLGVERIRVKGIYYVDTYKLVILGQIFHSQNFHFHLLALYLITNFSKKYR